jgi:hypothetical protein
LTVCPPTLIARSNAIERCIWAKANLLQIVDCR